MGSKGWRSHHSVIRLLEADPGRFDFYQAVRILERTNRHKAPVATTSNARNEAARFATSLSSAFPSSELDAFIPAAEPGQPPILTVNFMGLAGGFGPLPPPITQLLQARRRHGDLAAIDFLDLFQHRLIGLMMRSRRAHRPALQPGHPHETAFARYLLALLGLATPGTATSLGRKPSPRLDGLERSLLHLTGLLNQRPVSLHALERLLAQHFGVAVRGIPLQGRWFALEPGDTSAIGPAGRNNRLGQIVLGKRIWEPAAGITLEFGPLDLGRFRSFLPGGDAHQPMRRLLGYGLGGTIAVDARLLLKAPEVPAAKLGREAETALGWTSWLGKRASARPAPVTVRLGEVV
jgi:type VI secretion system protein ImpH